MSNLLRTTLTVVALPLLFSVGLSQAQDQQNPKFVPIEMYTCQYNKGKGSKDLQRVVDKWNKWTDENDSTPYTAWLLTPFIFDSSNNFDVGWIGAWPDGNAMGTSLATWLEKGGNLQGEFDRVIDCSSHATAASVMIKPPGGDWPGETGMTVFADCNIAEGKTVQDAMAAHNEWVKHLNDNGSKAGLWVFWPGFGSNEKGDDIGPSGISYDYKIVGAHPDMRSIGADWESFTNGGGWRKAQELTNGVLQCDSPRVYSSKNIRNGNFNPG